MKITIELELMNEWEAYYTNDTDMIYALLQGVVDEGVKFKIIKSDRGKLQKKRQ